jgi:hypothetical protein
MAVGVVGETIILGGASLLNFEPIYKHDFTSENSLACEHTHSDTNAADPKGESWQKHTHVYTRGELLNSIFGQNFGTARNGFFISSRAALSRSPFVRQFRIQITTLINNSAKRRFLRHTRSPR